jgi:hypothetical protein
VDDKRLYSNGRPITPVSDRRTRTNQISGGEFKMAAFFGTTRSFRRRPCVDQSWSQNLMNALDLNACFEKNNCSLRIFEWGFLRVWNDRIEYLKMLNCGGWKIGT